MKFSKDKSRHFTIYPSTVAGFNAFFARLPSGELSDAAKIFIRQTIQGIQTRYTEPFVKTVDK